MENMTPVGEFVDESRCSGGRASVGIGAHLRRAIGGGEVAAGERIRQETLAKQLGSRRLPVREALRILEGEGLVTLEVNKGARVTALDSDELDLLYGARLRIEPFVAADSVPRLTNARIEHARSLLETIESGVTPERFLVLDREFHLLSYEGCRSAHLKSIVERLWNSTQQYRRAFITLPGEDGSRATNAEPRRMLDAGDDRTADLATAPVASHITRTRVALRRSPGIFEEASFHPAYLPRLRNTPGAAAPHPESGPAAEA